ncbi:hypothetical protein MnTg02_01805 [bacterium MnTg02]|nr:hypothetical protein MnTg02_01805 [bacterium MnTg02]
MRWLLQLTLGLISAGIIIFTEHISVSFSDENGDAGLQISPYSLSRLW